MPIWDVVCEKCGKKEEVLIIHSQDVPNCSECGGKRKKDMGAPMFAIKGWSAANGYCDEGLAYADTLPDRYVEPKSVTKAREEKKKAEEVEAEVTEVKED